MKLHLGCGSVYLEGWQNIDVRSPNTFLATERPDLVARWKTTDANYYGRHGDKTMDLLRAGPLDQEYVCDNYGSFDNIPAPYWQCEELLARHSFEHLSMTEAHKALDQIDGIMAPNGILRLDVPDHEGTLHKFRETGDEFYIRHLLGPRRTEHGFHMMSYDRQRLRALVEEHGFVFECEEPNIHFFPAFTLRFRKPGVRAPRDYIKLPDIPAGWSFLDVGPGEYPHPRATAYADWTMTTLDQLKADGKTVMLSNLMEGLPGIADKAFDYVWCSHALEHVPSPERAAEALSRVAKRGTVIMPSTFKEMMFFGEESDHKWQVLPHPIAGMPPIFIRNNGEYMNRLRDVDAQKSASRIYRTGPNRLEEARYLRRWFYENEASLDVVHHWTGELKLQVIG